MTAKKVTIVGGGVAGLSAALELAHFGIHVDLLEARGFLGGHAIQFSCKATETCVRCGACVVEEKLKRVLAHPGIVTFSGSRIKNLRQENGFVYERHEAPVYIDPAACNNCGDCFDQCPDHAIVRGTSASHQPFYFLDPGKCSQLQDNACRACREACTQNAIRLDREPRREEGRADAVLLATGFTPFDPESKPYGYPLFKNVVTNLEMETVLRRHGRALRPSDQKEARHIAFVQCVGSRDKKLNHLWCSKVCCGSALRMAGLIKFRQPEVDITCFYIDIQSFGRDFEAFYSQMKERIRFVRAIPGDVFQLADNRLKVIYADDASLESCEDIFDLLILSVGLCPNQPAAEEIGSIPLKKDDHGFFLRTSTAGRTGKSGIFVAGAAAGPMSIQESIASAGRAANDVLNYLL